MRDARNFSLHSGNAPAGVVFTGHLCPVLMTRLRCCRVYCVSLICLGLYALQRGVLKPCGIFQSEFVAWHFTDLLFIPAFYPVFILALQRLHIRPPGWEPGPAAMVLHWAAFSAWFEWILPAVWKAGTGDWKDAVCYGIGMGIYFFARR